MSAATTITQGMSSDAGTEVRGVSRADLLRSDTELTLFFTSSLGVSAQPYESAGGSAGSTDFDKGLVHEIDAAAFANRATRTEAHDAVRATLGKLPAEVRHILARIYEPWGTGFVTSRKSASPSTRRLSDAEEPVAPDFLSIALTPRWGGGSFVRLALTQARTLAAFAKHYPDRAATRSALLQFLVSEAGRGPDAAPFFRKLLEDCEHPRTRALTAYDAARIARLHTERDARRARRDEAAKGSARWGEELRCRTAAKHSGRAALTRVVDFVREIHSIAYGEGDS